MTSGRILTCCATLLAASAMATAAEPPVRSYIANGLDWTGADANGAYIWGMNLNPINNVGEVDPIQAARLAAQEGIRIYTIGFGAEEMVVPGFLFQRRVNPSRDLDVDTLTQIADLTGGVFQRARSTQELEAIYEELDKLEPIEQDQETYRPVRSLYWYPLAFAMLASLAMTLLHPSLITWLQGLFSGRGVTRRAGEVEAA